MVSVLPYERTATPSPKNQPRSDGAYLKDYDSTQEFGFLRKRVELFPAMRTVTHFQTPDATKPAIGGFWFASYRMLPGFELPAAGTRFLMCANKASLRASPKAGPELSVTSRLYARS
jgi:hypothetical protein